MSTLLQKVARFKRDYTKISGSIGSTKSPQKAASSLLAKNYKVGSNHLQNKFSDKNGKVLKQNNVVKFTPGFFKSVPGNWQIYPSASAGRSTGDGEITLVNDTNGWNFTFDASKHKNFVSASFIEFVSDGPGGV